MAWPIGGWNQNADFEEGDLSDFDSTSDAESKMSAHADAAMAGSYGLRIDLKSTATAAYGDLTGPTDETIFTIRLLFDLNTLSMANNDIFTLAAGVMVGGTNPLAIRVKYTTANGFQWNVLYGHDAGTTASNDFDLVGAGNKNTLTVSCALSTGPGNDDGWVRIMNGAVEDQGVLQEITGIDSDTLNLDTARYGAVAGIDAGTDGVFYLDNCRWRDTVVYTQAAAGSVTPTGAQTKVVKKNIESLILLMYSLVTKKVSFSIASALTPTGDLGWSRMLTGVIRFIESAVGTIMGKESPTATVTYDESPTAEIEND
jgi:hypothetical protein